MPASPDAGAGALPYLGDEPSQVAALLSVLTRSGAQLVQVETASRGTIPQLREAWVQGVAGDRAAAVAQRLSGRVEALPGGLKVAAAAVEDYHGELVRCRRAVDQLRAALAELRPLESRVKAFGDWIEPDEEKAYQQARTDLAVAAARWGYSDIAGVYASYAWVTRMVTHAQEACSGVLRTQALSLTPDSQGESRIWAMPSLESAALIDGFIARGLLPREAATMDARQLMSYLADHPDVARKLVDNNPGEGAHGSAEEFLHNLGRAVIDPSDREALGERRQLTRAYFEGLAVEEQKLVGILFPTEVGNLSGAPFVARDAANYVNIVVAREDQAAKVADLQARLEAAEASLRPGDDAVGEILALQSALADNEAVWQTYDKLVREPQRQIVVFDHASGAFAEVKPPIGPLTENIGLVVPGTGTNMGGILGNVATYDDFAMLAKGSLSMVTWMGGPLPQSILTEAPDPSYAIKLGPKLAEFSHYLRQEAGIATGSGGPKITALGHSYGGGAVGMGEVNGLDVDRVLHVESSGMGHDVWSVDSYRPTNPHIQRYSMTAPGDPISVTQGVQSPTLSGLGHGGNPSTMDGSTRLATGITQEGEPLTGPSAHGGVFSPGSTAWNNMYAVLTGGRATLAPPSESYPVPVLLPAPLPLGSNPLLPYVTYDRASSDIGPGIDIP